MSILEQAKKIPNGVKQITEWLGDGGKVVDPAVAQRRADICLRCPKNVPGHPVTEVVGLAIRAHLSLKNQLKLRVNGEKSLHLCGVCGCVLRLLVHEPQERVVMGLTDDEISKLPDNCWKLKDWTEPTHE